MFRLVSMLLVVLALATGLSWLAERPGNIVVDWEGHRGELSVFHAVVIFAALTALAIFAWAIIRQLWRTPASVGNFIMRRKQKRGLDALSSGMIAVGAGDRSGALRYAVQARKTLPNEPLTHLLRAQAAQLSGDRTTARRIYEAMLSSTDTEQLGLRGLYLEASRMKETEAARQFAERAVKLNPKLSWPVEALFDIQAKIGDWAGALDTLSIARKNGHVEKSVADRRRAVLLTAQAQGLEETEAEKALNLALEAHGLAPSLVPAAAIAGRLLASRGHTPRAAKVLQKTWAKSPHPDLAQAYAYARIGDSPRDRLDRVKQLAALTPQSIESPIAVATTAIEARAFDEARRALQPMLDTRLTQRVATLMARIEGEEHGDKGKVREWLARAVNAPRDPAWTADGVVSERWAPASPVTGRLDSFQWRVPVDDLEPAEGDELTTRLESLVTLGASLDGELSVSTQDDVVAADSHATTTDGPAAEPKPVSKNERAKSAAIDAEVVDEIAPPQPQLTPAASIPPTGPVAAEKSAQVGAAPAPATATVVPATQAARPAALPEPADAGPPEPAARTQPAGGRPQKTKDKTSRPAESKAKAEPNIFVPPHAPDDPGAGDPLEVEDTRPQSRIYRGS